MLSFLRVLKGVPKPAVTWYFKSKQMDTFQKLSNVGEQLHITNAMLEDAGIYKCIATNVVDSHEVSSELIVEGNINWYRLTLEL